MKTKLLRLKLLVLGTTTSVLAQPTITSQPKDQSVSLGANVTNRVTASGTPPVTYQWRLNEVNIVGATNSRVMLTNVTLANAGDYTAIISDATGVVTSRVSTLQVDPTFTKITTSAIVTDLALSVRGAWGDYDEDGYLDLFVTSSSGKNNYLYHNEGGVTFSRVTTGEIVNTARDWRAGAWGDYDNDGHLDLYVTSASGYAPRPFNELYRNNGDGTFTPRSTNEVGMLVGPNGDSQACAWADYDRDGFLDLFVSRYGNDLLFHNKGDGSFTGITNSPVVLDGKDNRGCDWADYDNDGWPDLFTSALEFGGNFLYHNRGDGRFERITSGVVGKDSSAAGVNPAWVDYNNDGLQDLFVASGNGPNLLYRNEGSGTFTKITTGELITKVGLHLNSAWGDYDNDGYLDAFLASRDNQDNLLFRNNGDGTFTRVTSGSLVHDGGDSVSPAWADYDNDGFLDLFVPNGGVATPQNNFLYRNNGNTNHWLKFRLIGSVSNRSAIGAKLRVNAKIRGRDMQQLREISNSPGSGLIAHFGLGDASQADLVRIEWPSGTMQELHNLPAKQFLTIIEPARLEVTAKEPSGVARFTLRCGVGFAYALEASDDLKTWLPLRTNTAAGLTLPFEDVDAANFPLRFYRARLLPTH